MIFTSEAKRVLYPTGHKLRKIFKRNTIKLSYSCMSNVKQIIDGHNKNILKKAAQPQQDTTTKTCNCRKADECPLKGECLLKEVVYQAKVTTKEKTETCIGLTATEFKTRWRNHPRCHSSMRTRRMTLSSANTCGS